MIDRAHDANASVILHLGDFGFCVPDPSTRKYLHRVEQRLAEHGMRLLFVDGNHEDHARLNALSLDPATGLRRISDHLHHLPRGYRWTWRDQDGADVIWMALGGAVSVDRAWRTAGRSWWPDEVLSSEDVQRETRSCRWWRRCGRGSCGTGTTSSEILDIIAGRNRLAVAVRGGVAEHHLERVLRNDPQVAGVRRLDVDSMHDCDVTLRDGRTLRVECKKRRP